MTDYRVYRLKVGERVWITVIYMMAVAGTAVLFFANVAACIVGMPCIQSGVTA